MPADINPRERGAGEPPRSRGGGQPPRDRGVPGGRPPGPTQRLLTAAEELFGERSYHRTTVADICARAGMATGSFYSYFGSKAEIFAAVVRAINTDLRRSMKVALEHADGGQRARERASFRVYFDMLSKRPWIDRIVRESEFIDPALFREYYENLTRGYARGVRGAQLAREVDARYDPEVVAFAYTGIGNFVGMRWAEWTAGGGREMGRVGRSPPQRTGAERGELGKLHGAPGRDGLPAGPYRVAELAPVDTPDLGDLGRVGLGRVIGVRRVDRAYLVFQHPVVHPRLVAEPGQDERELCRADPELLLQPARHAAGNGLTGLRVTAARVGPHPGPGALGLGPPGQQELAVPVEQVAGERQVQRRPGVMHDSLGRSGEHTS